MPVRITLRAVVPSSTACPHPMRRQSDEVVHRIAPILELLRNMGTRTIEATASALNEQGIVTSRGSAWTYSTTRTAMIRAGELGYDVQVQRQQEAAQHRPFRYRG